MIQVIGKKMKTENHRQGDNRLRDLASCWKTSKETFSKLEISNFLDLPLLIAKNNVFT